jgi:putative transposase
MPRPPRISLEDALYYITSRCIYNQDIFKEESDYNTYFELLKKYKEQYKFKLFAYALLPNHFHLLLELPDQEQEGLKGGISEIMHGLNSSYTKYFNGKYGRKGHLFRDRFKTALVEKDPYLLKLTAYIHLNPQKLNLAFSAQDYPYSSYSLYIDKEMPLRELMQEEKKTVQRLLGQKSYAQFIQEIIKEGDLGLHNFLQKKGILGGPEFQSRVRAKFSQGQRPEEKTEESPVQEQRKPGSKMGPVVLVIVLTGLGLFVVAKLVLKENKVSAVKIQGAVAEKEISPQVTPVPPPPVAQPEVLKNTAVTQPVIRSTPKPIDVLDGTTWHIILVPVAGGIQETDTLTFSQKKFLSEKLKTKNFDTSNYSLRSSQEGKVMETMQTSSEGIALWRADISVDGKMKGVLSLRKEGLAVQDFTFSGAYWKEK